MKSIEEEMKKNRDVLYVLADQISVFCIIFECSLWIVNLLR